MSGHINWSSTDQLRADVAQLLTHFPDTEGFLNIFVDRLEAVCNESNCPSPSKSICRPFIQAAASIYKAEGLTTPPAPFSSSLVGTHEGARYRDELLALHRKARNSELTLDALFATLAHSFLGFIQHLPPLAFSGSENGSAVPLIEVIDVGQAITDIAAPYISGDFKVLSLFSGIREQLLKNQLEASGGNPKKLLTPHEFKGSPYDKVHAFLKHTPLEAIFESRVLFEIPDIPYRQEHTHILGPSGSGKTTLIQQLVLDDLARDDPPGMIIIDPKGLMIERLQKLDVFNPDSGRLRDRLVIVDPTHRAPPALNMFHAASKWNHMWSDVERSRIENQSADLFAYIFSSRKFNLTEKQSVPFGFAVRLMFAMDSTIFTLMDLMDDPTRTDQPKAPQLRDSPFSPYIGRLDDMSRRFFEREFFHGNFAESRQQIKGRLYSILQQREFVRMFGIHERKLDMLDCLQNKSIVLVNTNRDVMGIDGSQLLGRYMIAMTLNAAFSRFTIDKKDWHQAHLIVDEFQDFSDEEKTPELLRLAREYNLSITLAHQEMHGTGITDKIRSAISTNTTVKYAAKPEGIDINYVARDLQCDPAFLAQQKKTGMTARFACMVRGLLDHPVSLSIPIGAIEKEPKMTDEQLTRLLAANSARLSSPPVAKTTPVVPTSERAPTDPSKSTELPSTATKYW